MSCQIFGLRYDVRRHQSEVEEHQACGALEKCGDEKMRPLVAWRTWGTWCLLGLTLTAAECELRLSNPYVDATFSLCTYQLVSLRGRYSAAQGMKTEVTFSGCFRTRCAQGKRAGDPTCCSRIPHAIRWALGVVDLSWRETPPIRPLR